MSLLRLAQHLLFYLAFAYALLRAVRLATTSASAPAAAAAAAAHPASVAPPKAAPQVLLAAAPSLPRAPAAALVSLADMHGDVGVALASLALAGVADPVSGAWTGGTATLVQTGDLVDRGNDSVGVLHLFWRLRDEAEAAGGRVVLLLGNHELWALSGYAEYASATELRRLGGRRSWVARFGPGGDLGAMLRSHSVAAVAGDGACRTLFVHAGLPRSLLASLPAAALAAAAGGGAGGGGGGAAVVAALDARLKAALDAAHGPRLASADGELLGGDGALWTRVPALAPARSACAEVAAALAATGARRMVVGHTVQEAGWARSRCGGRLVLADTGASYSGRPAALVCGADGVATALGPSGEARPLPLAGGDALTR